MFSWARRSAWTVVKAREVTTRETTSRLVNRRIFWVSPTGRALRAGRRSVVFAACRVVAAVLLLVRFLLEPGRIDHHVRAHAALGRYGDLHRSRAPFLE